MQKVAIMTFPNSPSYGASLQMYALYQAIAKLGHDVEVINYMNMHMKNGEHFSETSKSLSSVIRKKFSQVLHYPKTKGFRDFEKKITLYPKKVMNNPAELKESANRYSRVVVGSDQVWNPKITGFDTSYLLDFCADGCKRIAYAPSFGVNVLEEQYQDIYRAKLELFDALSVREVRGKELIYELTGLDSTLVLDPSMLLTKEEWKTQIKPCKRSSKGYIVRFIFNHDERTEEFIDKLSKKTGLPVYEIAGHVLTPFLRKEKDKVYSGPIGPMEWLDVIHNAEYVVTDSFHGAAFSIILEKKLFVSLASATNSRLITLLDSLGLNDRIITNVCNTDVDIDYAAVAAKMSVKREASLAYLCKSLE